MSQLSHLRESGRRELFSSCRDTIMCESTPSYCIFFTHIQQRIMPIKAQGWPMFSRVRALRNPTVSGCKGCISNAGARKIFLDMARGVGWGGGEKKSFLEIVCEAFSQTWKETGRTFSAASKSRTGNSPRQNENASSKGACRFYSFQWGVFSGTEQWQPRGREFSKEFERRIMAQLTALSRIHKNTHRPHGNTIIIRGLPSSICIPLPLPK